MKQLSNHDRGVKLTQYLAIPKKESGMITVLKAARVEVPLATRAQYPTEVQVDGAVPDSMQELLPVFGAVESNMYALNSGGRGILASDGDFHLRFKGNDVDGSLTMHVARSPKNLIADVGHSARRLPSIDATVLKDGGTLHLPSYEDGERKEV